MTIPAGFLDQRVYVSRPDGRKDARGKPIFADDVPRWAGVDTRERSQDDQLGAKLPTGEVIFVMRLDSFTKKMRENDRIRWDGSLYVVKGLTSDKRNARIEIRASQETG